MAKIYLPSAWGPMPVPDNTPRVWDPRLDKRAIELTPTSVVPPGPVWKIAEGHFLDQFESQGRHHVYVELEDENGRPAVGVPVLWWWGNGDDDHSETKFSDSDGRVHFETYAGGRSYGLRVLLGFSDSLFGMGMGYGIGTPESPISGEHTSYKFNFRRVL